MKVLVIGNGGREDAICHKVASSSLVDSLYCSNGNAGTLRYAKNIKLDTNLEIKKFCEDNKIDLVIIGPEKPLCEGLKDDLDKIGVKVFGADFKSAKLEGSKEFAKKFMLKHHLPTAKYISVNNLEDGILALNEFSYPVVLKADGLCAGKGVKICEDFDSAKSYLTDLFENKIFGNEGMVCVIEEFLKGEEASLLCFVSGDKLYPLESARDYKKIYDGDLGDNTGGVGCYSPSEFFDNESINNQIKVVLNDISKGLKEDKLEYIGILFIGFMIVDGKVKILEFNVRFGDPETEVVLPRLNSDLVELILKAYDKTLEYNDFKWSLKKSMTVVLTSNGYPNSYEKNKLISGLETVDNSVYVYHNNTKKVDGNIYSDGGRVLSITTLGDDFEEMRNRIYSEIDKIDFENKSYRKDIAIIKK